MKTHMFYAKNKREEDGYGQPKVTIIGAGSVSSTIPHTMTVKGKLLLKIVLIDINQEKRSEKLWISSKGTPFCWLCTDTIPRDLHQDAAGSKSSSGLPRKAGQSRLDLAQV